MLQRGGIAWDGLGDPAGGWTRKAGTVAASESQSRGPDLKVNIHKNQKSSGHYAAKIERPVPVALLGKCSFVIAANRFLRRLSRSPGQGALALTR